MSKFPIAAVLLCLVTAPAEFRILTQSAPPEFGGTGGATANHIFSPSLINSARVSYLRHRFFFDQRLNQTPPSALGFGYASANADGQGPPFFNISGYSPIGGAITGPRSSTQGTGEVQDGLTWTRGAHLVKLGGGVQRSDIDMFQAIAPNAFYVFAWTFPTNNAIANLLLGAPVTFYQGLGDFSRDIRVWGADAYAQDEWRINKALTLNYGIRYERINPITEAQNRMKAGQFGSEGRNAVPGPGYGDLDLSLVRNLTLTTKTRLELRVECFNLTNHANLGLPVADLNSPNFGKILLAGPPRLMQFAAKLVF